METERGRFRRGGGSGGGLHQAWRLRSALAGSKPVKLSIVILLLALALYSAALWCPLSFRGGDPHGGEIGRNGDFSRRQPPGDELLAGGIDSCRSRYEAAALRRPPPYKPSSYLVQRLRQYEALHRRCAPHGLSFNRSAAAILKPGGAAAAEEPSAGCDCKYILWTPAGGLGNRILSLSSTFLYAILTGRVLLIDRGTDFSALMCEPFPGATWLLPSDFPIGNLRSFGLGDALSYGALVRNKKVKRDLVTRRRSPPLSFAYLHLVSGYSAEDAFFFCEEDQLALREVPWLLARSDNYFVPALFLNALFEAELGFMFPEKEAVFHLLCRYLFHPSNKVWDMVTAAYNAHLALAAERVGIQIRVFDKKAAPFEVVLGQVINCTKKEEILMGREGKTRAVLVTSLYSGYLEGLERVYGPENGDGLMRFYQPSSEGRQVKGDESHDMKAWAEIYLLGLADVLVTTAQSTFGYVGQALAGVKPWILVRPEKGVVPEPACVREVSLEPCFHSPPHYVCRKKNEGELAGVVPYVAHCTDVPWGVKLVDRTV